MPQAFEAIALKTRWSPFLKSLLPLVLSQLKTGVLPKSQPRMVYLLKVGATEPGKLNIASFSASRLSTTLNPYQGLKQINPATRGMERNFSTTLNPYQGLKQIGV